MTDLDFDDFDDFDSQDDSDDQQHAILRFEQEVSKKMKLLLTRKAGTEQRVEAARWLGEAGSPQAIYTLRQVYKREKDKKVKKAAEYALGMFKALDNEILRDHGQSVEDALSQPENAEIYEKLTNIALKGEFGKRKRIRTSALVRFMMLLMLSLIVLVIVNFMLLTSVDTGESNLVIDQLGQSNSGIPALDLLADLDVMTRAMRFDATEIQAQFTGLSADSMPANCAYMFNRPEIYDADASITITSFQLESLVQRVNDQVDSLDDVQTTYDNACDATVENPISTDIDAHLTTLETLLTEVDSIEAGIGEMQAILQPVSTPIPEATDPVVDLTEEVTEEAGPTATPTITPEPTTDPAIYFAAVREMNRIINLITEPRRALEQLEQAWRDVSTAGTTGACSNPVPDIPEDYVLPDEVADEVPELIEAANQLNGIGLTLLRNGWDLFTRSCANGTLAQNASTGLTTAQTSRSGFNNARQILNNLSN